MAITVALFLIVIGSVLFHLLTPWWLTPLASNWKTMDDTLGITLVITGIFFVAINLFVVYALWRYRHREGRRADYRPDNKRLERWLIIVTSVGIAALLAPGLVVYADYINPPRDALTLEVVAQQWQWRFRLPGVSGKLGGSDARFVNAANPLGLDPADPDAQDNLVVLGNEVHLPLNRPVKVIMRSHDVLHDFFVPNFRARMNIVPGQVSWYWFTPNKAGRYESMCAQLCGVGHPNMRATVVVEDEAAFRTWVQSQPTFAQSMAAAAPVAAVGGGGGGLLAQGKTLAQSKGCAACHSIDGSPSVGPTWKGLFGKTETLKDGTTAKVDESYLKGFIRDPRARSIKGFPQGVMPKIEMSEDELAALVAYIKSHGG